jgi:hypothetical protein
MDLSLSGAKTGINSVVPTNTMETTVSLNENTRDALHAVKEEQSLPHYDATVSWLIKEVNTKD